MIDVKWPPKLKPLFTTQKRFIVIYGGRDSGKSWGAAGKILMDASQGKLCACCREINASIDASMAELLLKTIDRLKWAGWSITEKEFKHVSGGKIFFKGLKGGSKAETRSRMKSIEGVDTVWLEEAESISEEDLNRYVPTFRKPGSQQIFTFNRYLDMDAVYKRFCVKPDNKTTEIININYWDNPFCPEDEIYEAEKMKAENYPLWLHTYGGEPASQGDYAVFSLPEIKAAMERDVPLPGDSRLIEVGMDVARYGDDSTVLYGKIGNKVVKKAAYGKTSTVQACDLAEKFVDFDKGNSIFRIDDTGVGGGVTDEMKKRGYNVAGVNFAWRADNEARFGDIISEMWFNLKAKIDDIDLLDDDDSLKEELSSRLWSMDTKQRRKVETKKDFKKRIGRSPDNSDALMLCFYDTAGQRLVNLGDIFG